MSKLKILYIVIAAMGLILVGILAFNGHPNQSNDTIEAIHKDTTQRNILQTKTNKLLGDIIDVLEQPQLIECK